jgi:putative intracellular protease/amidase
MKKYNRIIFFKTIGILTAILIFTCISSNAQSKKNNNMKKKILFVLTSHDKKGDTGESTGYFLSEVSHPWDVFDSAGYKIDFVSPKGGKAPVEGVNLDDLINEKFWNNSEYHHKVENTLKPTDINPDEYVAVFYAGGHGTMWDFPDNETLAKIAAKIYENNGIIGAVCHGPSGLLNIKLSNGKYLIEGKKINGFTNEEENAVKLTKVVPFLLEDKLKERGVIFEKSAPWQIHVVTDQRIVTGQNPQSAHEVGEAMLSLIKNL